jgi:N-acetylmuramoyl-L-alanine amidase
MEIEQTPSPNFNDRKADVDMLVLHYTGMESGEAALARMCDVSAEVSAHYMVWEDGRVTQMVAEDKRAWHAGVGSWQGDSDLNSCSIGIEIVNGGHDFPAADGSLPPYPAEQIAAVMALCHGILARHTIPQPRIVGHSDIAPARKADPGEHFPWDHLAKAGIGIWPDQTEPPTKDVAIWVPGDTGAAVAGLQDQLAEVGYGVSRSGIYDAETQQTVLAFQRRWAANGRLDGLTAASTLSRIAEVSRALTRPLA